MSAWGVWNWKLLPLDDETFSCFSARKGQVIMTEPTYMYLLYLSSLVLVSAHLQPVSTCLPLSVFVCIYNNLLSMYDLWLSLVIEALRSLLHGWLVISLSRFLLFLLIRSDWRNGKTSCAVFFRPTRYTFCPVFLTLITLKSAFLFHKLEDSSSRPRQKMWYHQNRIPFLQATS